jgi:hypothetical protein
MLKTPRKIRNSPFLLFPLTLLLVLLLSLPLGKCGRNAQAKAATLAIDGIMAALEDDLPRVKQYALDNLTAYDLQDLKSVGREPEDIAKKAAEILKDEKVDANVRASAASALSNLGQAAAKYVPDIVNFLKDEKVDAYVRASAARH